MRKRKAREPLSDAAGEVRELTVADMKKFEPMDSALLTKIGVRGPQKAPTKERITIRLSRDVLERFRASGSGWQGRMDEALRAWLKRHSPEA